MSLPPTPSQTVGPFFGYALPYPGDSQLVPPGSPGAIQLHGRVLDGAGEPVPDALLELWQSDASGRVVQRGGSLRRDGFAFTGWGRASTDPRGHYSFSTLLPGTPFFSLTVFARGMLQHLFTRAYLPGGEDDALLASLAPDRRDTLLAAREGQGFRFDVRLQGEGETVFLTYPRD